MSKEDLEVYVKARPYIRAVVALLFALRHGAPAGKTTFEYYLALRHGAPAGKTTFEYYFVMADDFLTTFEQRRS